MAETITYRIANHYFSIEGDAEASLVRTLPGFPVFYCESPEQTEWTVRFGCLLTRPEGLTELYSCDESESAFRFTFAKAEGSYYFYMAGCLNHPEPLLMRYSGGSMVEATHCTDPSMLRFALWMAYSLLSASSRIVLIHSSVIVHQGRAVLFLGESGTGKSTHTRLWLQNIPDAHLLNDDSPILTIEEGRPVVYGTPWSGKTHCYHALRFPLAAAVRLSQAPHNKIKRQSVLGSFTALQPSCPPSLAQDEYYSDHIISLLSDVISAVPVYRMECLPDAAAAQLSHDTIYNIQ